MCACVLCTCYTYYIRNLFTHINSFLIWKQEDHDGNEKEEEEDKNNRKLTKQNESESASKKSTHTIAAYTLPLSCCFIAHTVCEQQQCYIILKSTCTESEQHSLFCSYSFVLFCFVEYTHTHSLTVLWRTRLRTCVPARTRSLAYSLVGAIIVVVVHRIEWGMWMRLRMNTIEMNVM